MIKLAATVIGYVLTLTLVIWGVGGFIPLDWNVLHWTESGRTAAVEAFTILMFIPGVPFLIVTRGCAEDD